MIIRESLACGKAELDIFTLPPTQTVMESARWDTVQPYSNFSQGTVIFDIEGDNQCYLDLSQTELYVKCSVYSEGTKLTELVAAPTGKTIIGPVNNLLHSMFSQVQVKIAGTEVENSNSNYSYRAMYENLLCYGPDAKSSFLTMEGWVKDTAGSHNNVVDNAVTDPVVQPANAGWKARRVRYKNGCYELKGKLKADMFNLGKYIIPMVNVNVMLTRAPFNFCFMGAEKLTGLTLKIEECNLQVRRVKVSKELALKHAMGLEEMPAQYPVKRVIMRALALPNQATSINLTGIHRGIMPSRVVVGFVDTSAYTGSLHLNPFKFEHLKITTIKLKVASVPMPYADGIKADFVNKQYTNAYDTLFQNIRNMGNDITYEEFAEGYTLFPFDLTPGKYYYN
jgi:hypothetical protein